MNGLFTALCVYVRCSYIQGTIICVMGDVFLPVMYDFHTFLGRFLVSFRIFLFVKLGKKEMMGPALAKDTSLDRPAAGGSASF